ncbi:hypothetical protein GCM10009799_44360 [Nocardiopsis rhodophaea]|uniref:Uncharacterized protein n=1 Tax=Nocardiopsis rhodophaea TaxID=280238 RepID=A0ABP5EXY4_9ACTN
MEDHPEIGQHVTDPRTFEYDASEVEVKDSPASADTQSGEIGVQLTARDFVGTVNWRWNNEVTWSFDKSTGEIEGTPKQESFFTDISPFHSVKGTGVTDKISQKNEASDDQAELWELRRMDHIALEIPNLGVVWNSYPETTIEVDGSGQWAAQLLLNGDYIDGSGGDESNP